MLDTKKMLTKRSSRMRITAAATLSLVGVLVAGCGSSHSSTQQGNSNQNQSGSSSSSNNQGNNSKSASNGPMVLTFWSAESGAVGKDLNHLVNEFNTSQSKYKVNMVYKGTYPQVLAATIAAFKAHKVPNITMIYDVGTATAMNASGAFEPVYKVMKDNNVSFSTSNFIGAAGTYYANSQGNLDSLPFASSTPVLYYNKKLLKSINAAPPKTWTELAQDSQKLVQKGLVKDGFTTGWPAWVNFEQFSVWNGLKYATQDNGVNGTKGVKLLVNSSPAYENHISDLAKWSKNNVYVYDGTQSKARPLFTSGKVAFYIDSSASYASIASGSKFAFGEAPMPYVQGASDAPQNSVVGGNSLWLPAGQSKAAYAGDAAFLHFLMSGKAQGYWASKTGYVPVTQAGVQQLKSNGFYKSHPDALVAVHELTNKPAKAWTRAIRLGDMPKIRQIEIAALQSAVSGKESPKAAIASIENQGNAVLKNYAAQN